MLLFKLFGAFLTVFSGVMLSVTLNRRASLALRRAEGWARLIGQIKREIECFSLPASDILARVDGELLTLCGYCGKEAPRNMGALLSGTVFCDGETMRIARSFASEFGRCYREEQVERCAYFLSLMEERRRTLASEMPSRRRLNMTLCMSGSLCALILLL